jgi:ABC-type uncharacterized transport system involved in gliding motility auxiliary subunit
MSRSKFTPALRWLNPLAIAGKRRQLIGSVLSHLLLLTAAGLIAWLGYRYSLEWDWSTGNRNSLSETSQRLLGGLHEPLTFTAYVRRDKLLRREVRELIARYQRFKPDIELIFVNPDLEPDRARKLGITQRIELDVSYADRQERLRHLNEEALSNAIFRISQRGIHWIVAMEGHGERNLLGNANHDLGLFGEELGRRGFRIQPLDLTRLARVPDNTEVLVIAGPRVPLPRTEMDSIRAYLEGGGNLLWLTDPGDPPDLAGLADMLGIRLLPGVVVDANVSSLGLDDPAFAVIPRYPDHPLTRGLQSISLFPKALALETTDSGTWQITPILRTLEQSWNETGPIRGEITVDPDQDEKPGPLTIGLALSRTAALPEANAGQREQRLVVVGDGDFLSNAYLGNGGNLDLGLNILRWLTGEDDLLDIPVQSAPDRTLNLSRTATAVIGLGFLLVSPSLLVGTGLYIRWRRRRL